MQPLEGLTNTTHWCPPSPDQKLIGPATSWHEKALMKLFVPWQIFLILLTTTDGHIKHIKYTETILAKARSRFVINLFIMIAATIAAIDFSVVIQFQLWTVR